jgi:hypothetical protein
METTEVKKTGITIELDSTLIPGEIKKISAESFNKRLTTDKQKTVRDCIEGEYRHTNYMEYLEMAWGNHYGVIMSPDIFWFILLNESASHIKENSEYYRSLFTTATEGKVDIIVPTADPQLISLNLIANELRKLVPTDIDIFLPSFSTSTVSSAFAFKAAFADAMTPYYNYMMLLCGIPKIQIQGTSEDWNKLSEGVDKLKSLLNKDENIMKYFERVQNISKSIINNLESQSADFWKGMFSLERCGSGGQVDVRGWIVDMYIKKPRPAYVNNFPTNTAKVPYKLINTGQNFELSYGLFSSNIEDGFLVPDFGFIINEVLG